MELKVEDEGILEGVINFKAKGWDEGNFEGLFDGNCEYVLGGSSVDSGDGVWAPLLEYSFTISTFDVSDDECVIEKSIPVIVQHTIAKPAKNKYFLDSNSLRCNLFLDDQFLLPLGCPRFALFTSAFYFHLSFIIQQFSSKK